jgi:hypothetical protein
MRNAMELISNIYSDPDNHLKHAQKSVHSISFLLGLTIEPFRFAVSFILSLTYGKRTSTSVDDPEVLGIGQTLQRMSVAAQPGAFLVDYHPWLK